MWFFYFWIVVSDWVFLSFCDVFLPSFLRITCLLFNSYKLFILYCVYSSYKFIIHQNSSPWFEMKIFSYILNRVYHFPKKTSNENGIFRCIVDRFWHWHCNIVCDSTLRISNRSYCYDWLGKTTSVELLQIFSKVESDNKV